MLILKKIFLALFFAIVCLVLGYLFFDSSMLQQNPVSKQASEVGSKPSDLAVKQPETKLPNGFVVPPHVRKTDLEKVKILSPQERAQILDKKIKEFQKYKNKIVLTEQVPECKSVQYHFSKAQVQVQEKELSLVILEKNVGKAPKDCVNEPKSCRTQAHGSKSWVPFWELVDSVSDQGLIVRQYFLESICLDGISYFTTNLKHERVQR